MKLFRKLFGLDFPDPEVGQVWASKNSGRLFRITDVEVSDCGYTRVSVQRMRPQRPDWNPLPMLYSISLSHWRQNLRQERRVLVTLGFPFPHVPRPAAWPPPPPSREMRECDSKPISSTAPRRERQTMEGEITMTKPQLQAALQTWEQQARDGNWQPTPDLPVEQVAAESADHLWGLLVGVPVT